MPQTNAKKLISALNLEAHVEGGYFRRTFQADHRTTVETERGQRYCASSIYYMLTHDSSVGKWHCNQSDILHFFHRGNPIEYSLIHPDGSFEKFVLGKNLHEGQLLQLAVKGGTWKSSRLLKGKHDFALISEAVTPGFDYADMRIADETQLSQKFPQHAESIKLAQRSLV